MGALAFGRSGIERSQRNIRATFIQKDQPPGVHLLPLLAPLNPLFLTPFTGSQRLFYVSSQDV